MRRDCRWFSERANIIWSAQPARSMLLLVPQGCDETEASHLVRQWTIANFRLPLAYDKHVPVCISLTSDSMQSCAHFASTFAKRLCRPLKIEVETDPEDYPTDIIQLAVEALLGAGYYPIIIIERFHAFALIRDPGMTSVLSGMRSLEHAGQLTTLSISPLTYTMIRRMMKEGQPFLNSVYGDNHDLAFISPLSREDFVMYATDRGISNSRANWLYSRGGGPDVVYSTLVDLSYSPDAQIIERCIDRVSDTLDRFLERSFAAGDESQELLLSTLAVGRLLKQQVAFLTSNPLSPFLIKRSADGNIVCSSQILARKILRRDQPKWSQYGFCLDALANGEYIKAGDIAGCLDDEDLRLTAFKNLVLLRSSLYSRPGLGLLGIDWVLVRKLSDSLVNIDAHMSPAIISWVKMVSDCAGLIVDFGAGAINRLQVDALTSLASNGDVRVAVLFMIFSFVKEVSLLESPSERILHLVNIPEAILQAIASGFCNIDYRKPPELFPTADYDGFFGGVNKFSTPASSQKMTLASLLVVVPALLSSNDIKGCDAFTKKEVIRPLQQKLVDCVRNPASHTIVEFLEKDSKFLQELCFDWVGAWIKMEGYGDFQELPLIANIPTSENIAALLVG
ncbi:hypothetical protein [Pseudomonas sp. Pdm06]|uniref:hypothetical protein n=1 Tax=Pseudomonas sp. Pdm06 TaxID=1790044 RepID=UPI0017838843|nr:hypothetical protein [Pseudomonas sp. Pdm06]MBD9464095.1 hypothetical protein [Pseudomonas sp. Pdm06]